MLSEHKSEHYGTVSIYSVHFAFNKKFGHDEITRHQYVCQVSSCVNEIELLFKLNKEVKHLAVLSLKIHNFFPKRLMPAERKTIHERYNAA